MAMRGARLFSGLGLGLAFIVATSLAITSPRQAVAPEPPASGTFKSTNRIQLSHEQRREAAAKSASLGQIQSLLNVPTPLRYGEFVWDETNVAAGPVWIRVDLQAQTISIFRGGHEIGIAVMLYGADGKPTPPGQFTVLAKSKDHQSGQYDAPMPYSLWLTKDGVAIHGSNVRWGSATHGCVGVPIDFARKLFDATSVGDRVTVDA